MTDYQSKTLTLLVENEFGVLTRVTALIRRRGYNIGSLAVAETMDEAVSRITLTLQCDEGRLGQIVEQLRKQPCVITVSLCKDGEFMSRELIMVRVKTGEHLPELARIAGAFHAHMIEATQDTLTMELADLPARTHAMVEALEPYGIVGLARTGVVALNMAGLSDWDAIENPNAG